MLLTFPGINCISKVMVAIHTLQYVNKLNIFLTNNNKEEKSWWLWKKINNWVYFRQNKQMMGQKKDKKIVYGGNLVLHPAQYCKNIYYKKFEFFVQTENIVCSCRDHFHHLKIPTSNKTKTLLHSKYYVW